MKGRDALLLAAVLYHQCPNIRRTVNDFAGFYLKNRAKEAKVK